MMSGESALALKTHTNLSDQQYQILRNASLKQNADIYPTLINLKTAQKMCYPTNIHIGETEAKVELQSMVDHTLVRVVSMSSEKLSNFVDSSDDGVFYFKSGFDGASSQSVYNQKYDETNLQFGIENEQSLFMTAITPLKFTLGNKTIWLNEKPSSPHFCRPLHLQYKKETKETLVEEEISLRGEIELLSDFQLGALNIKGVELSGKVKYKVEITMLDGKAVNALVDCNSTQSCNVCKAKPKEMNDLELVRTKEIDQKAITLGLSTLHMWIRSFEFILHLGYKMEIKKFMARSKEEKASVERRKVEIKRRFREEMSLVVDTPKAGCGNTNTGNTARRSFGDPETFAEITGVSVDVVTKLSVILRAVCSCYHLNLEAFKNFCFATSELIVSLYGWYTMPPSVHKLLEHGYQVANYLELPLGAYSEEAQEASNKAVRNARLHHSCKISRKNVMSNQIGYLLIRSDPIISSVSFKEHKSYGGSPLSRDVEALLLK